MVITNNHASFYLQWKKNLKQKNIKKSQYIMTMKKSEKNMAGHKCNMLQS